MTHRTILLMLTVSALVWCTPAPAQTGNAASDPVTGHWGTSGFTFLELQFDGKSTVTGTTIWREGGGYEQRAAIKTGTYDTPSHILRLTGEVERNGKRVPYEIKGVIDNDTFTGSSVVRNEKKKLTFTRQ